VPPAVPPTTLAEPQRDEAWYESEDERESGVRARPTAPTVDGNAITASDAQRSSDLELAELVRDGQGTELGAYHVIERIGSGAMGHVFRAEHRLLGRAVAIKMLRPELIKDEACVQRFLAEARAVNLIGHANIIDVTDFARTPSGQPWFVMELLEGSDLAAALLREPMAVTRALAIARQLCDALAAVHTAGIVHRDVKPENTFLAQVDGKDFVKLLDFGIARLPDPTSPDPLQEGLVGTPQYMAPEQVSASAIDHRADIYGFGSLLYELLTGRTPFRANDMQELLAQVLLDEPLPPSQLAQLPEVVRADLDALVLRCLAKKPAERPASAREIAETLDAIMAKLEAPVAVAEAVAREPLTQAPAPSSEPQPIECVSEPRPVDVHVDSIEAARVRKRARQVRHAQRVWSSRSATLLAAAAAALAMWIATSERSWAHAAFWRDAEPSVPAVEHIVRPAPYAVQPPAAETAPVLELAAPAPVLVATTAAGAPSEVDVEREAGDQAERSARRARAKARAERRAAERVRPELVITPSRIESPEAPLPAPGAVRTPPEPPVLDRDLVLNPFAE
jgi:serine/threonine-protein kinase